MSDNKAQICENETAEAFKLSKLLCCPFCGFTEPGIIFYGNTATRECSNCHARGPVSFKITKVYEEAVSATDNLWNTRAYNKDITCLLEQNQTARKNKSPLREKTMNNSNQETKVIPFSKVKALIENIPFGRLLCSNCGLLDHECDCTPNVIEKYRQEIIDKLSSIAEQK